MAPSERAKQMRRVAEGGRAAAQLALGWWHHLGEEGLERDDVKAVALFREAADLGLPDAQYFLARSYGMGRGVEQNNALAAEWGRKAADQGDEASQFFVGTMYAFGEGVKKDLPLGKTYLELSAAQGSEHAIALLKDLRQCVACGKLDVHHMICSRCHNRWYCDADCQLQHWNNAPDSHILHCVKRRESVVAGRSSLDPTTHNDGRAMKQTLEVATAAAAAKMDAAKAAVEAARVAAASALTEAEVTAAAAAATVFAATSARAAMLAAPAASKKEKKKKAQLVAKLKAAETAAQAAVEAGNEAGVAWKAAEAVLLAAITVLQAAREAAT